MPFISVGKENSKDIEIYYKDWGSGQPVVFSHGWPLTADAWEDQMVFLGAHGYRCIAHDRRGYGRSSQPWSGNDMDTYADDLAALAEAPMGTIWSSSPCMMSVGTSNFLRSSVRSVSENALMQK